jgi:hypothetical protein
MKMNTQLQTLAAERAQLRQDMIDFRQPKRVPIMARFSVEAACGLAHIDLRKAMYDPALLETAMGAVCGTFYSDASPFSHQRFPWAFQAAGSHNAAMATSGSIQVPEAENLLAEEWDEFIADPITTMIEKIQPRAMKSLQPDNPQEVRLAALRTLMIGNESERQMSAIIQGLADRYGYMDHFMGGPFVNVPFDFIADHLRSFRGAFIDLRRVPDKVKAASKALLKICKWLSDIQAPADGSGVSFLPLHTPAFMGTPQFEEYYWPDFEEYILFLVDHGWHCNVFAEGNWDRYYEFMERLPDHRVSFQCEEGDPVRMKQTFGKSHLIGGLYDPTITLVHDKEKCIDEAKRLVDVVGKDGGFYFCFNKNVLDIKSIDVPKLAAVLDWVRDKAVY